MRFGVTSFIYTLDIMYVVRGSTLLSNDGSIYPNLNSMDTLDNAGFVMLSPGTLLGTYLPTWLTVAFLLLGCRVTTKTPFDYRIYAAGGNEPVVRPVGIPIIKAKIFVYTSSGPCAALVGLIVVSQL